MYNLHKLIWDNKYSELEDLLKNIDDIGVRRNFEIRVLIDKERYHEGLEIIEECLQNSKNIDINRVIILTNKGWIYNIMSRYNESIDICNIIIDEHLPIIEDSFYLQYYTFFINYIKALNQIEIGINSVSYAARNIDFVESISDDNLFKSRMKNMALFCSFKANYYIGNLKQSHELGNRLIANFDNKHDLNFEKYIYSYLISSMIDIGEIKKSYLLIQRLERIKRDSSDSERKKKYLHNIIYDNYLLLSFLQFDEPLIRYYFKKYVDSSDRPESTYISARKIKFYRLNNNLEKLHSEIDIMDKLIRVNLRNNNKSLNIAWSILQLIIVLISIDDTDRYEYHLNLLKSLDEDSSNDYVHLYTDLSIGLVNKNHKRLPNRMAAQRYFEKIINGRLIWAEGKIIATLNLVELLIDEYKLTKNDDILDQVDEYISISTDFCEKEGINYYLLDLYFVRASFSLIKLDISKAKENLDKAIELSIEIGSFHHTVKFSNYYDDVLAKYEIVEEYVMNIDNKTTKVELLDFHHNILDLISSKNEITRIGNDYPLGIIIFNLDGIILLDRNFTPAISDELNKLLGKQFNMITVEDKIYRIRLKNNNLLLLKSRLFCIAYVFQGQSYLAIQRFQSFIDMLSIISSENDRNIENILDHINTMISNIFDDGKEFNQMTIDAIDTIFNPYKFLLHPIKLSILRLLHQYFKMKRVDLLNILSINSGTLSNHLSYLEKMDMIGTSSQFIEDRNLKMVYFTEVGMSTFSKLRKIMNEYTRDK